MTYLDGKKTYFAKMGNFGRMGGFGEVGTTVIEKPWEMGENPNTLEKVSPGPVFDPIKL
jgi:hypothetical protein